MESDVLSIPAADPKAPAPATGPSLKQRIEATERTILERLKDAQRQAEAQRATARFSAD